MLLNKDFVMQGGVRNYLGETEEVTAPKYWKSSKDSPSTELVYITEAEKGLLADANLHGSLKNGKANIGASGLLSFDGWGSEDPGQNRAGGDVSRDMDRGRDDGNDRMGSSTGGGSQFHGTATPSSQNNDDIDSTYTSTSFEVTPKKSKIDQLKEFFSGGGVIGNIAKGFEPMSKSIQSKAMTWSLNRKIKSRMANLDLNNPNTMKDPRIVSLQKDLQGVKDGTFTQRDYTAKYGSGDATNPLDASFNPSTLNDNDRQELENLFAPELSYAIGDTTPQNSIVNEYFSNIGNTNLGISNDFLKTYNKAKDDLAKTLNMTTNASQFGYNANMSSSNIYYNYLKDEGLL
tara:strand:- start:24943 stop:25980 length:1038 start_codon:yes stop_codon:yes gene_type:complete